MGNDRRPRFLSNNAGGILGGISTGQPIVARFAVKPTSSILNPRRTVDRFGNEAEISTKGRHDPCVGIRAVPIGEAMMACVLADHYLRHRGQVGECSGLAISQMNFQASFPLTDSHQRVDAAIAAFARGEIVVVTDDDDRENEGDLFVAASLVHAGEDGLHHPQHLRHRLRAGVGGRRPPAASRSDGRRQRRAARHRLHRIDRLQARADHRDLGGGAHQHRACACQQQQRRLGLRAARPRVPADRARGRRADAFRPYGGLHRSLPAGRPAAGRRAVGTDERRRLGDARAAGRRLCREAQAHGAVDCRSDRASPGARETGHARRRVPGRIRRSGRCRAMPM